MPLPLTDREREIATLISQGLSNIEIAEAFTLSVRTIEGHIYRACAGGCTHPNRSRPAHH
jgi:DNA-binding CsgD family transcriptional regulator